MSERSEAPRSKRAASSGWSEAPRSKRAASACDADRFGELPDELLPAILSFLPSRDAVRTCVLARRWRDQWKSAPALRISRADAERYADERALNKFINCLVLLRNRSPLREVEVNSFEDCQDFDESVQYLELWIRYSLSCNVEKLSVCGTSRFGELDYWVLPRGLVASTSLKVLKLARIGSYDVLDFSSCTALKDLSMESCNIHCDKIMSPSLEHLKITSCDFTENGRVAISVPKLISFQLVDCSGRAPLLESMPSLVSAFVRLQQAADYCQNSYETGCEDDSCEGCHGSGYGKNTCVLLEGLSGATNLELTAEPTVFIFRKDLICCPIFSKLKTLLLSEWCMTANLGALICFLQHSPVLEKLTLQFSKIHVNVMETEANYGMMKQGLVLKHLSVEVKCHEVDEHIQKVVAVLVSYGLPLENVKINEFPALTAL